MEDLMIGEFDGKGHLLILLPVFVTVVFGWGVFISYRLFRNTDFRDKRLRNNSEHGLVIATTLLMLGIANIITGVGLTSKDDFIVEMGAILARGALLATAIYLLLRHPRPPKEEE
jgi:hypothetical protein